MLFFKIVVVDDLKGVLGVAIFEQPGPLEKPVISKKAKPTNLIIS
jgi:hypothetical protein